MLKICLVAAAFLAFAWGQFNLNDFVIDELHGYRVEYDDTHNIILFANDLHCYIVVARDTTWDAVVTNENELHLTTSEIYQQIVRGEGLTPMTQQEATDAYHSRLEAWECRGKDINKVAYVWHAHGGA